MLSCQPYEARRQRKLHLMGLILMSLFSLLGVCVFYKDNAHSSSFPRNYFYIYIQCNTFINSKFSKRMIMIHFF